MSMKVLSASMADSHFAAADGISAQPYGLLLAVRHARYVLDLQSHAHVLSKKRFVAH